MKEFNTVTGITFQELQCMTNDGGRKFLAWLSNYELIGTTERGARSGEFIVIYKNGSGEYHTAVLSKADEKNDGSCFFGSVLHYARVLQSKEPVNKGIKDPFFFDAETRKNVKTWIGETFGIPRTAL